MERQTRHIERLIVERDLHDSRVLSVQLADGTLLTFDLHTISNAEKNDLRVAYNASFPAPPTVVVDTHNGKAAQFDIQDPAYIAKVNKWQTELSTAVLARSCGLTVEEAHELERVLTNEQYSLLHSTVGLLNGIHAEPMGDLLKSAMWSEEVTAWLETYKPSDPDGIKITDTVLFREMECMVAGGLTLDQWELLSPRARMTYLEWHSYKQARESYTNWYTYERPKNRHPQKPW